MIPAWLHVVAILWLASALSVALLIAVDVARRPQHMWIMNVVWPVTAVYSGVLGLLFYLRYGRAALPERGMPGMGAMPEGAMAMSMPMTPYPVIVAKSTIHCGSGCVLGDVIAENVAIAYPAVATWFGWGWLFGERLFAIWLLDFVLAYAFGIAFQYFVIKPMRNLSPRDGLIAAVKADTISLIAWQVGMYGFMAFAIFYLFPSVIGTRLVPGGVEFWFAMQVAMMAGFVTSFPANILLLAYGIKEKM